MAKVILYSLIPRERGFNRRAVGQALGRLNRLAVSLREQDRMMKWSSAISIGKGLEEAVCQCASKVSADVGGDSPASIVVVFVSQSYSDEFDELPRLLNEHFPGAVIFGCSAQGVIGNGVEEERDPAVAITVGHLPGVSMSWFRATGRNLPTPDDPPESWANLVGVSADASPSFLILMDPMTTPGEALLSGLDFAFPDSVKIGGVASGAYEVGSNALFVGTQLFREGAVGLALTGNIQVDGVVAQGCRPIGEPKRITKSHHNLLLEVDEEPPMAYLQDLYPRLSSEDQALMRTSLLLGIALNPMVDSASVRPADFLIRSIIGGDQERGLLAVGEVLHEGQLVQFHVRDAYTSAEDLQNRLDDYLGLHGEQDPAGALLFQCNGRGVNMYGVANHDSDLLARLMGPIPVGGFFCGGEIGPVGGVTCLHGFTSSLAIFREPLKKQS